MPAVLACVLKELRGLRRNDVGDAELIDLGSHSGFSKHLDPVLDGAVNRFVIQQSITACYSLAGFWRVRRDAEGVSSCVADLPPYGHLYTQRLRFASQDPSIFPVEQPGSKSNRTNTLFPSNRKNRAHASFGVTDIL